MKINLSKKKSLIAGIFIIFIFSASFLFHSTTSVTYFEVWKTIDSKDYPDETSIVYLIPIRNYNPYRVKITLAQSRSLDGYINIRETEMTLEPNETKNVVLDVNLNYKSTSGSIDVNFIPLESQENGKTLYLKALDCSGSSYGSCLVNTNGDCSITFQAPEKGCYYLVLCGSSSHEDPYGKMNVDLLPGFCSNDGGITFSPSTIHPGDMVTAYFKFFDLSYSGTIHLDIITNSGLSAPTCQNNLKSCGIPPNCKDITNRQEFPTCFNGLVYSYYCAANRVNFDKSCEDWCCSLQGEGYHCSSKFECVAGNSTTTTTTTTTTIPDGDTTTTIPSDLITICSKQTTNCMLSCKSCPSTGYEYCQYSWSSSCASRSEILQPDQSIPWLSCGMKGSCILKGKPTSPVPTTTTTIPPSGGVTICNKRTTNCQLSCGYCPTDYQYCEYSWNSRCGNKAGTVKPGAMVPSNLICLYASTCTLKGY
jgi:hypothetical protein